jgi:Na+-transporting methylmalonyl-CoA/oxaloacetate decarboxylase gamma subunit
MLLAQQDNGPMIEFTLAPLSQDIGIPLAVMGIFVVFMALILVVVFITILPRIVAVSTATDDQPAVAPSVGDDQLSEETVVVISAAVAQIMAGRPHRVVRIQGLTPADLGWSLEGRMQHHQSHRVQGRLRR